MKTRYGTKSVILRQEPPFRYVSGGDSEKLTVPSVMLHILGQKAFEDKRLQVYYRGENNGF